VAERLRRHAADLARRAATAVPAIRDVVLGFVATCAAEDAYVDGRPDPDAWADVARRWTALRQPYPTAYAELRSAEAAFARRARSAAGADALRRAAQAASAMGAAPLLAEIHELAEHARVPLDGSPAAGPTSTVPEPRLDVENSAAAPTDPPGPLRVLTGRELEVLEELAGGLTNREIAGRLFISEKTVGVHVGRIYHKLGVRGRVQATSLYRRTRDG